MEPVDAEASLVPAEPETPELNLHEQSLDSLAEIIRHEHEDADAAANSALVHALRAGEALLEARTRIEHGKWMDWLSAETELSYSTANLYMRVATHRARLLTAQPPIPTLRDAIGYMVGQPDIRSGHSTSPEHLREQAKQMHADGLSAREIAREIGYGHQAVRRWIDPEVAARQNATAKRHRAKRRAEGQALREKQKREQRDAAAKQAGGSIADAYSYVRRLAAAVDRAADQANDQGTTRSLRSLNHQIFKVEDEIVRIIGEANGQA